MTEQRTTEPAKPKAALRDVAARAGVSSASVSRVLNNPQAVSEGVRRRVQNAMAEMEYVPHWAARSLATRRSRTIGAVVPTLGISIFATGVEALQNRLQDFGYTLLLASTQYDVSKEATLVSTLLQRGVDGLVLVGHDHDPTVFDMIKAAAVPLVTTYHHEPAAKVASVGFDNQLASYRMVEHLLDLGHRKFGLITTSVSQNDRVRARLNGMLRCLADNKVHLPKEHVIEARYSIEDGRRALRALFTSPQVPTAVACTTDVLAIGAVQEAAGIGLLVPRDLSITGFDDLELSSQIIPPLTTIHVPADEIGHRTAELILSAIEEMSVPKNVELTAELILRRSTAPPTDLGRASAKRVTSLSGRAEQPR